VSAFEPRDLLAEQLVLSGDARGALRVWSVRRPADDGRSYRVELWSSSDGAGPAQVELPFSLAAAPRVRADGALTLVGAEDGPAHLWSAAPDGSGLEQLSTDHHVLDAEPSPAGMQVAFRAFAGPNRFLVGEDTARRIDVVDFLADGMGFRDRRMHAFLWDGGRIVQLTEGDVDVYACGWSGDGSVLWLVVGRVRDQPFEEHELWTVAVDPPGSPQVAVAEPGWVVDAALAPDGSKLAWLTRPDFAHETRLQVLDVASGEVRRLDAGLCCDQATFPDLLPLPVYGTQLAWEEDGGALLALATVRGVPGLHRFPLDGSPPQALTPGVATGLLRRADGVTLLVGIDGERPAELLELTGAGVRHVSAHGGWFPEGAWPHVRELTVRNGDHEVHGWVLEPPGGAEPEQPVVLHVHGGPYNAHGPVPWLEMVALAARGYTVLAPNPRGSVSYGDAHSTAIVGRWGTVDADDLQAFVNAAEPRLVGDASARLGVIGLSYGGYMTVQLLGTSRRFAAAVAENPVTNFVSEFGMSDLGALGAQLFTGGDEIDLEAWFRSSPLARAHTIRTPLLLLQGERDDRCPLPESMQPYVLLKALGREVELVRFPEESHLMFALARPDRRVYRLECILDWFDRHL
jgi:dipeptidyl aminopeptidase/acylaminoacyl peptidase